MRENLRDALEFHLEGLALDRLPMLAAETRLIEVPEEGFAEWLDVRLQVAEAISA